MKRHLDTLKLLLVSTLLALGAIQAAEFTTVTDGLPLVDNALLIPLNDGVRRVRLQELDQDTETWQTRDTIHLDGQEGRLKLRLPDGVPFERLRISKSLTDPFPHEFYRGKTRFRQSATSDGRFFDATAVPDAGGDGGDGAVVEESDIWQWRGDTLYFFNQYRGLQVFDLSDRASPERLATLRMPAVGEEMYLLDETHVALLTNRATAESSEVIIVRHTGTTLEEVVRLPIDGTFVESRMVGGWLYTVSRQSRYQSRASGESWWQTGLTINAFDLTDPENGISKTPLALEDDKSNNRRWYNSVVTATPDELLITTSDYNWQSGHGAVSTVHVIDIRDPAQALAISRRVALEGQVQDKFKLGVKDGVLFSVAHVSKTNPRETYTRVESHDLRAPAGNDLEAPRLDTLRMADNETLFATRFDNNRLYVVTFRRIDPLFVLDIADPSDLRILGELEVPGFSTYLQPMGERLLSVGVQDRKVAISLFDVSDAAKPSLLKRVTLGEEFSWSDANFDEKAVGFLPDQSLLLVPYQSHEDDTWVRRYQLLDITQDDLVKRGVIDHDFYPRRATALDNFLVSISGFELLVSDATNRDTPTFVASHSLAWSVDRLFTKDDYLLQLDQGYHNYDSAESGAQLRVSPLGAPDNELVKFSIGDRGIVGATLRGDMLYIAQADYRQIQMSEEPDAYEYHNMLLTKVVNLSDPLNPMIEGVLETDLGEQSNSFSEMRAEFMGEDHLVWLPTAPSVYWWGGPWRYINDVAADVAPGWPIYFFQGRADLVAINIQDPANLLLASHTVLDPDQAREFSAAFTSQDQKVLISHSRYTAPVADEDPAGYIEHYAQVVDFNNPAAPLVSDPVSIPGRLEHVYETANDGTFIFTSLGETVFEDDQWRNDSLVHVSVFDGATAYLVDEINFHNAQWTPLVFNDNYVFKASGLNSTPQGVLVYGLLESGLLERVALLSTDSTSPNLMAVQEDLLFATHSQGLEVFDIRDPLSEMPQQRYESPVHGTLNHVQVGRAEPPTAWLPEGLYGVETLDLSWLPDNPLVLAQDEEGDWVAVVFDPRYLVRASNDDYVGALGSGAGWQFRAGSNLTNYNEWASAYFDPNETPEASIDSDGDGLSNWVEYALASDPTDSQAAGNLSVSFFDAGAVRWVRITYPVNWFAPDVSVFIEQSGDLQSWASTTDTEPTIWVRPHPSANEVMIEWPMQADEATQLYRLSVPQP